MRIDNPLIQPDSEGTVIDARFIMGHPELHIHLRADPLPPSMRNKSILIAIVMMSSSLAGCSSDNSEEDLNARFQEGYDAGYGDAYDASYDGVAQHYYNEGWDDGWEIANSDSQAEIMEMRALASSLNETIVSLQSADLSNADLSNANLSGADLSNANLSNANLAGADLSGTIWYGTICPDGTNSDDNGNTCENNL